MSDPYRSGHGNGTCPRCSGSTEADGELGRLACAAGCGEWYPKAMLDQILAWDQVESKPASLAPDGTLPKATAWPWGASSR